MTDKERIEQLEYEISKKDKRLAEQYHEIVYLNNKVNDIKKETCNKLLHELEPLATLTFNDYKLLEQTVIYWEYVEETIKKIKGE